MGNQKFEEMLKNCHKRVSGSPENAILNVLGRKLSFTIPVDSLCPACLERYFNENSRTCDYCKAPILPHTPIAEVKMNGKPAILHYYPCAPAGSFCGHWGEGEIVYDL